MRKKISEVPDCKEALEKTGQRIYDTGYATGYLDGKLTVEKSQYEVGYRQGLGELWEAVKKIFLTSPYNEKMNVIFGDDFCHNKHNILTKYSPEEVIQAIKNHEEDQKKKENDSYDGYRIGDEVMDIKTGKKGVVINIYNNTKGAYKICVWCKGIIQPLYDTPIIWKKTGKNFTLIQEFWDTLEDWSDKDV